LFGKDDGFVLNIFLFFKKHFCFFLKEKKFSEKKIEENLKNPNFQEKYFPRRRKLN